MSSFTEWKTQFDRNVKATIGNANSTQKEAVAELLHRIEERTPVGNPALWKWPAPAGYTPGTLKASWGVEQKGITEYTITNNQPYAERVETGWSSQAPAGMLRISLLEWSSIIDKIGSRRKI